jgi:predicted Zn-dependent peptidase
LDAKNAAVASKLLRQASEEKLPVDLARALIQGASVQHVVEILEALKEVSPESVRHVIRAYVTKVVMSELGRGGSPSKQLTRGLAVLEDFNQPFNPQDQLAPLLLSVCRLLL